MAEDSDRRTDEGAPPVAVLDVVPVDGTPMWTVRITVPFPTGPVRGWVPYVFWSEEAANTWVSARVQGRIMPCVRDCPNGPNDLAVACITTDSGIELVVSEPVQRVRAAGVAAMFAAEFRARQQLR